MRKTLALLLISTLVLGGCATIRDSRINPLNWFGGAESTQVAAGETNPLIPRRSGFGLTVASPYRGTPVDQITGLTVERVPGGAIIRIEAVAARQGSYNVVVEPATPGDDPVDGVLDYTLLAEKLPRAPIGTPPSRRIVAAHSVSDDQLAGVRTIRVSGARNTLTVRR